jgi:hypothetical protein
MKQQFDSLDAVGYSEKHLKGRVEHVLLKSQCRRCREPYSSGGGQRLTQSRTETPHGL